jgi:ceramide glucosyltransferase
MDWYYYIACAALISQGFFLLQMWRNHRYALAKYEKKRRTYRPRTVLIVPCKGVEAGFERNIASFFGQEYEDYLLWFVVAEKSDPAYDRLYRIKETLAEHSKACDVRVLIAGATIGGTCSQKIHNLLHCYRQIPDDVEVMAFADSDVCISGQWLSHIVYPLRKPKNGASSGYRWFVPQQNNLATLALSAVNAKIAQLLGDTIFNLAWGGSMAIRVDTFRSVGLERIWQKALSDDLALTAAVKKAKRKVAFVPACFVASYEQTSWRGFFEFGRRQFLITRVYAPGTWWFGLFSSVYSILGLWAGAVLAVYAVLAADRNLVLYVAVPVIFFAGQLARAILRQATIARILTKERRRMAAAAAADICLFWLWSWLLLGLIVASAFGRTIRWRGICYRLLSPSQTVVVEG